MNCQSAAWIGFNRCRPLSIELALAVVMAGSLSAGSWAMGNERTLERAVAGEREFARMRTVVEVHCLRCHGEDKSRGGLSLSTLGGWLRGGDSGPAIQIDDPEASAAVRRAREGSMPPLGDGRALTSDELGDVVAWILGGAYWPEAIVLGVRRSDETTAQDCGTAARIAEFGPCRTRIRRCFRREPRDRLPLPGGN
ncbi:MAG: hypothetical protein FJ295_08555 [Planctomycetes bacterium]|nr:hypothetical protein [Planctomycetota bacterium]